MTVKQIAARHARSVQMADKEACVALFNIVQTNLQILVSEGFGGEKMHLSTGMGCCCLWSDYTLLDPDERFPIEERTSEIKDDQGVLDYVEPGNRKCSELVCTPRAKRALIAIWEAKEFLEDENLTTVFPFRVFADRHER